MSSKCVLKEILEKSNDLKDFRNSHGNSNNNSMVLLDSRYNPDDIPKENIKKKRLDREQKTHDDRPNTTYLAARTVATCNM